MNEPTTVITPARYRLLWQEAAREIERLSGDAFTDEKVREIAVTVTATVLSMQNVGMVPTMDLHMIPIAEFADEKTPA